jgi:hypothetical protein
VENGKSEFQLNSPERPPLSPWAAPGSIILHWLGSKSWFQAHTGTWSTTLFPSTRPATFTLKHQGNWWPCISLTQKSHCSMGNKRCKPAGLVPPFLKCHGNVLLCRQSGNQNSWSEAWFSRAELAAAPWNCTPWSPCGKSGHRISASHKRVSPELAAEPLNNAVRSLCGK